MWVEMLDMVAAALAIIAGGLLGYGMMLVIGEWRARNESLEEHEVSNPTHSGHDVGAGQI